MKKILTLILSSLFTSIMYGQILRTSTNESYSNGNWVNSSKVSYTYDWKNYLIKQVQENWDVSSSAWKNSYQFTYINNNDGTVQQNNMEIWGSPSSNSWNPYSRTIKTYNSAGKELTSTTEQYSNGNWVNSSKLSFTYDGNNYLIKQVQENWDISSSAWKNSYQFTYINNNDGTVQQNNMEIWGSPSSNSWNSYSRTIKTYNSAGKELTSTAEQYSNGNWVNSSKLSFTYDGNNYLIKQVQENWDVSSSAWKNSYQFTYINNNDGTVQQNNMEIWGSPSSNSWNPYSRTINTYDLINSIEDITEMEMSIFPNPTSDFIKIEVVKSANTKILIMNLQGQQLITQEGKGNVFQISVDNLPKGTYLIKLEQSNATSTRSFIKM